MSDTVHRTSLGETAARNLADVTKTKPQMGAISPRWLLRMLPWTAVESGLYRLNKVRVKGEAFERVETRIDGETAAMQPDKLRAIPLFQDLDDSQLAVLASKFKSEQVPAGTLIFKEGDDGSDMFVLAAGKVEVFRKGANGKDSILSLGQSGDYFGEVALVTGATRNASVRAILPSLILKLTKTDLAAIFASSPVVADRLLKSAQRRTGREESSVALSTVNDGESAISSTFVDYDEHPQEIALSSIVTTLRVHTRIMDLYK